MPRPYSPLGCSGIRVELFASTLMKCIALRRALSRSRSARGLSTVEADGYTTYPSAASRTGRMVVCHTVAALRRVRRAYDYVDLAEDDEASAPGAEQHAALDAFRGGARDAARARWRAPPSLGLVPTMGALHAGHLGIVERARRENAVCAASLFVNPTQFAPGEDLSRYPAHAAEVRRADLAALARAGADVVLAPADPLELFGDAHGTYVEPPPELCARAEGAARPGHFRGVATVVTKLFGLFRPTRAYFGQKDALQAAVLRVVARELDEAARVVVVPTARADDGLALSSRNVYLTDEQRAAAPVVHAALAAARDAWRAHHRSGGAAAGAGGAPRDELVAAARAALDAEPLVTAVDYVSVADYDTMGEIDRVPARAEGGGADPVAVVSVALRMGEVRLIDNIVLDSA